MFKKILSFIVVVAMSTTIALPRHVFASEVSLDSSAIVSNSVSIQDSGIIIDDPTYPPINDDSGDNPTYPPTNPPVIDDPTTPPVNPPIDDTSISVVQVDPTQPSAQEIYNSIKVIEENYLNRNTDGTFSIDQTAETVIDQEVLSKISTGMQEVNYEISQGTLTSRSDMSVVETTPSYSNELQSSSSITSYYSYIGVNKVVWRWYGEDIYADANKCASLKWTFYKVAGWGATAGGILSIFCGGATIPLLLYAGDALSMAITLDQGSTRRGAVIQCIGYRNYSVPFNVYLQ